MHDSPKDPSPPRRKLSREARQQQLIEATIDTLARQGYARTTMAEVARTARLSHGLVNFHFTTKERLLAATLDYLAEEYLLNWQEALAAAGPGAPAQIAALIRADFDPRICTPPRLAAWCAFWGEAQSRPLYQDHCGSNDARYISTLEGLCARMNAEHGFAHDPVRAARILRLTVEGSWLDMMTMLAPYSPAEAHATVLSCANSLYPGHFATELGPG